MALRGRTGVPSSLLTPGSRRQSESEPCQGGFPCSLVVSPAGMWVGWRGNCRQEESPAELDSRSALGTKEEEFLRWGSGHPTLVNVPKLARDVVRPRSKKRWFWMHRGEGLEVEKLRGPVGGSSMSLGRNHESERGRDYA